MTTKVHNRMIEGAPANILDFGAVGDGVADDTQALLAALAASNVVKIPAGDYRLNHTTSVDITGKTILGESRATSRIFFDFVDNRNNFITNGNTTIEKLFIDGGWDGVTSGQNGDIIAAYSAGGFTSNFRIRDCRLINAKRDAISMSNIGYSSISDVVSNASGRHGLHLDGAAHGTVTSVVVDGMSVFSDCPYGYGTRIVDGHNISLTNTVSEYTQGIEIAGGVNRAIRIASYYQEFNPNDDFLTLSGSGIGLTVQGCFGGGKEIKYNGNFFDVLIMGNSNMTLPDTNMYNWSVVGDQTDLQINKVITSLGSDLHNNSGASPAHVMSSAPINVTQSLVQYESGGTVKAFINGEGGYQTAGSHFGFRPLTLGNFYIWVHPTTKNLMGKEGAPANDSDGVVLSANPFA